MSVTLALAVLVSCAIAIVRLCAPPMAREVVRRCGIFAIRAVFTLPVIVLGKTQEAVLFTVGMISYLWNACFGVFPRLPEEQDEKTPT